MTKRLRALSTALGVACALSVAGSACRDSASTVRPSSAPAPRTITPRVVVTPDQGAFSVITLALDVSGGVGKLGSFTGRLHFDPAALGYDSEVTINDATARASNPGDGVIRVAGMSQSGIDVAHLASFRFKVIKPAGLDAVQFELEEVHELGRANMAEFVRQPKVVRRP